MSISVPVTSTSVGLLASYLNISSNILTDTRDNFGLFLNWTCLGVTFSPNGCVSPVRIAMSVMVRLPK